MTGQIEAEIITVNDMVVAGPRGLSAYELAVLNGYSGTEQEWLASLKGDEGEQGPQGEDGEQGIQGETGNGIASITKSATSGLTDTYTVTYTSGNTTTFFVTNGKGISTISKVSTSGLADTYRVTFNDNTYFEYTVTNGANAKINGLDTLNISAGTNISIEQNGSTLIISADSYDDSEIKNDIEDIKSEQNTQKLNIQTNKIDISSLRSTKANVSDLSQVATTGAYGDLSGKPVIGTGLLTLQKNSEDIGTFGANSTSSKTINIEIPTKTSDINNNSGFIDKNVNNLTNYTKTSEMNVLLSSKANSSDVYSKTDVYNKTETDTLLNTKQNTLTFDTTPTENSTNPVTSGGIYDSQEEQNTNIELLQNLVNQMPTVEATGTDISLQDVLNYRFMKFVMKGNSSQFSTTGKNLLINRITEPTTSGGITLTPVFDENGLLDYYLANGTVTSSSNIFIPVADFNYEYSTSYIVNGFTDATNLRMRVWRGTTYTDVSSNETTITTTSDGDKQGMQIRFNAGATYNNIKIQPMIRLATITDSTYEPYTGGIPAPNPDYPFPVKTVTGENSLVISNADNTETQIYPLSLGNMEFNSSPDGTIRDQIVGSPNEWYKREYIGKVVLDGSENWINDNDNAPYRINISGSIITTSNNLPPQIWINNFQKTSYNSTWSSFDSVVTASERANPTRLKFRYTAVNNLEEFKTWLSTHNSTVYYVRANYQDIPITDTTLITQLNNIYNNAHSYNGTTNITTTYATGNEQMVIEAGALKNVWADLNTRLEILESEV